MEKLSTFQGQTLALYERNMDKVTNGKTLKLSEIVDLAGLLYR